MPGRRRSVTNRLLLDVNALAIAMVDDHPGHPYVEKRLRPGFAGDETLLVFDYLPFRVQWVLTSRWGIETVTARNAVSSLLDQPLEIVSASRETMLEAYDISADKNHDVFDSLYVALAREHDADEIVTTDTDFDRLCRNEEFDYCNPVPDEVLAEFYAVND